MLFVITGCGLLRNRSSTALQYIMITYVAKRVSMGLTIIRQTAKKLTVNRQKWKILPVDRHLNQA